MVDSDVPSDSPDESVHIISTLAHDRTWNEGHDQIITNVREVIEHELITDGLGKVRALVFDIVGQAPVTAVVIGKLSVRPLVRIHSRCLYSEVLGADDCDCRAQLSLALQQMQRERDGLFIYLEQDGRGHGLVQKAKGYRLSERDGVDSVEAFRRLGLSADARNYDGAVAVLRHLGIESVRLLTNNPEKTDALRERGVAVEQLPLRTIPTEHNRSDLESKQTELGHDLGIAIPRAVRHE